MKDPALIVVAGGAAPDAERSQADALMARWPGARRLDELALEAALADPGDGPGVALLLPSVPDPLATARRLRRAWPDTHLLITRERGDLQRFQRSLGATPMLGRYWSLAPLQWQVLEPQVEQALAEVRQRRLFRARVDRANAMLAATEPVARGEYQRLLASEHHLANFLRHAQDAVVGFDAHLRVLFWSRGAEQLLGEAAPAALGRNVLAFGAWGRALRPALEDALAGATPRTVELELPAADGRRVLEHQLSLVPGGAEQAPAGVSVLVRDVTERRLAHEQLEASHDRLEQLVRERTSELEQSQLALIQAQKLDAIGKLTGGVAHDFNNVLQVIGSNLQLLTARLAGREEELGLLKTAFSAVERGAKLSLQLLAFARRQPLNPLPLNISRRVQDMGELLRRTLGEPVQVETVLEAGLWTTLVDPVQLENVILNLAINARDAMPGGGKLTLETANTTLAGAAGSEWRDLPPGQYVMLAVSDTGTGMSPEVAAHAFEPFFTTKPEGKGTGLGLSMAYGFAKQSGGHIRIYSELGAGTTVKLYLPRSHEREVQPVPRSEEPVRGGSETILVVEDDRAVQAAAVRMLQALGYRTLKADDAQAALSILQSGVHVDLLFTDVVMPGPLRSPELAQRARALLPHLAVLFTSGYTQNAIVHGGKLDPGVQLLSKPYRQEDLARKVRQLLEACAPAGRTPQPARLAVLLVEDEPDLRETTEQLLELLDCSVVAVDSAESAEKALEGRRFDVVITDISLPGRDGVALAQQVAERSPETAIVLCSGYGGAVPVPPGLPYRSLPKPYGLDELRAVLAAVAFSARP